MNVRDDVQDVLDYLTELSDSDDVSPEGKQAIQEGLEDIRNGRTISLEEFRRIPGF